MIKELFETMSFTSSQQQIIDYILMHPDCILSYNAKELSQQCYISSPTIIRFVKKLGFKGYNDFQIAYTKEYMLERKSNDFILRKDHLIDDSISILPQIYEKVILETKQMIKKETVVRVINYMLQAQKIDFYANDNNFSEIESACLKLNALGIRAQAYNTLNISYINNTNPSDTLSFVVSHTGRNATMCDVAYELRKRRFRVIAITGKLSPTLEIICNESLFITSLNEYNDLIPHSMSIHYILDLLILIISNTKKNKG